MLGSTAVLHDAFAGTASGQRSTLLIEGAAGIGKTRLSYHLIDLARRVGLEDGFAPPELVLDFRG